MIQISVKFTTHEIELLSSLASDQFIDSRLPGFRSNPADLSLGKKLVERMRLTADRVKKVPVARRNGTHAI